MKENNSWFGLIKDSLKNIRFVYQCAPFHTSCQIILTVLIASLVPLQLVFIQEIIQAVPQFMQQGEMKKMLIWCGIFLLGDIFLSIGEHVTVTQQIKIQEFAHTKITLAIARKLSVIKYEYFEDKEMANTIRLMGNEPDVQITERFQSILSCLSCLIILFGSTLFLIQTSILIALSFAVMIFLVIIFNYKGMDLMNEVIVEQGMKERKLEYLSSILSNKSTIPELRLYNGVKYIVTKWRALSKVIFSERLESILKAQKYFILTTLIFTIWVVGASLYFGQLLFAQKIALGIFTALVLSIATIMASSEMLSAELSQITRKSIEMRHYYQLQTFEEVSDGQKFIDTDQAIVSFEKVSFAYPNSEKLILNELTFTFTSSESIAIVGKNGAGKSTLIKLLLRLYLPTSGRITINGVDIREINSDCLHKIFGVVFQDFTRYSMSLRENVALGNLSAMSNDQQILAALDQAAANDLLTRSGLDTELGKLEKSGVDFSGGQWQKIALARALVSHSLITILDEPTAAMDPMAESEMYQNFFTVIEKKGSVMISHRLASAKIADRILVVDEGIIKECGSHKDLIAENGLYKTMFQEQSSWYK
ncbi:hypothetical protein BAU15_09395 [Enterococcus sp. JM4C]|uniref:ABC transporter ATP-binding protein n=1 Tax=Candidatus Enterococcus huntleyi TaxID=1857217 RepID=UPI001379E599|nr:ABC transporter ATP-binding protein [Enterococcus sp. JM4C]KAF1298055.1 hypothetical protein BAU15_09395 [Enterococcus sp. JM4C]